MVVVVVVPVLLLVQGPFLSEFRRRQSQSQRGLGAELTGQEASARKWKQKISRSAERYSRYFV